jgi:hypothetical protein
MERGSGILLAPATWSSIAPNVADSFPQWGPNGVHQYSGTVWDPASKRLVFGGDAEAYITNPKQVGSAIQYSYSVFVFNPYATTPKRAWRRITVPSTSVYCHSSGMLLNSDGTVSFRGLNTTERFTVNPVTRTIAAGVVHGSPIADQYQAWRHTARDPSNNKTYEVHQKPVGAAYGLNPQALYETTSGGYVEIAQLPSSYMTVTADEDYQSAIVIVNGKAYVCNETAAASGTVATLGVHQINLSTGAVVSFTTSGSVSVPELSGGGTTINGLHGRFAYISQVGCFVAMPSARSNAWVFRPPSSWVI